MPLILKDVTFSYAGKKVISNLNLTLEQGSRTALMGSSGCGKTTLLRLMAGLAQPDSGKISGIPAQGVSVVFQENRLLPTLSVLDNLKLIAPHKTAQELTALLGELHLESEAGSYPAKLSGGMKRRVAIARAMAFESPLLLLDEPFTGLDEAMRAQAAEFILKHSRNGILVAVTHAQQEAELLKANMMQFASLF